MSASRNQSKDWRLDQLEDRRLLAWGTYPVLIGQDRAVANFPGITGKGVNIAQIDSGVDFNHANLQGVIWTNPNEIAGNGKDDDADGYVDDVNGWDFYNNDKLPEDQNNHGTATAGIMAAKPFTFGGATYQGIATGAKIIPLKVSDPTGAASLAFSQRVEKALQWVEANYVKDNIRIINMSVRTTDAAEYFATYSDEISRLSADGVLIIAAGGQEDPNADVVYPAADAKVYGVSVLNSNGTFPVDTVNRGPGIDLLAPGNGVPLVLRGGGFQAGAEATSYSTPFVSAAAALILQLNPNLTPAQVIQILKDSGQNVKDTSTIYAHSGLTYKRINIYDALRLTYDRFATQKPFVTPPGANATIQAENFDVGGDGIAYHDIDAGTGSTNLRTSGVELAVTNDTGGGYAVTSTRPGEWIEYTVNLATAGTYSLNARFAAASAGGSFHVEWDGVAKSSSIAVPATGSASTWSTLKSPSLALTAGTHVLRIAFDSQSAANTAGSYNYFSLVPVTTAINHTFTSADIGLPRVAGSTVIVAAPSAYNLASAGADFSGAADNGRFLYTPVTGNFDISVRVASLSNTQAWAKAGLMVRNSVKANSRNVFALVTPGANGYHLQSRASTGGTTTMSAGTHAVAYPNSWIRLKRVGNLFTAYYSTNGTSWTQYSSTTVVLNSTVYVGLALSSGNPALTTGAKFRGLSLS